MMMGIIADMFKVCLFLRNRINFTWWFNSISEYTYGILNCVAKNQEEVFVLFIVSKKKKKKKFIDYLKYAWPMLDSFNFKAY